MCLAPSYQVWYVVHVTKHVTQNWFLMVVLALTFVLVWVSTPGAFFKCLSPQASWILTWFFQTDFMGYTLSVTRLPTRKDLEEDGCVCSMPEAVTRALGTLFDTSLLKSPSFIMLCFSGFFTLMGIFTPFMYIQGQYRKLWKDRVIVLLVIAKKFRR